MLTIKSQKEIILFAVCVQSNECHNLAAGQDTQYEHQRWCVSCVSNNSERGNIWIIRLEFVLVKIYFQVYLLCFVFLIIVGVLAVLCNTFVLFLFIRHKNVSVDTSLASKCHSHLNQEFLSRVVNVPNIKYLENASCTEDAINRAIHSNYYRVLKV